MSRFFPPAFFAAPSPLVVPPLAALIAAGITASHRLRIPVEARLLDDSVHLDRFPTLNASRSLWDMLWLPHWQEHATDALWRPVAKMLWSFVGLVPVLPSITTVLLAALCAGLLAAFLLRCRIPPLVALMAALVPICHPLAADILLPLVGQMDLLAGVGLMGALLLFTRDSPWTSAGGVVLFAGALLSKESVLPALAAVPLAAIALSASRDEALRKGVRAAILLATVIAGWFAARSWIFANAAGATGTGGGWYQEGERRLSSTEILGRAIFAFFDPRTPQTDYSFLKQPDSAATFYPAIGMATLMIGFGAIIFLLKSDDLGKLRSGEPPHRSEPDSHSPADRPNLRIAAALMWIVVFLVPYLQIIPIGALWAGRFAFLSLFGLAWLLAELITLQPVRNRSLFIAALAALLLVGTVQINRRAADWSDAMTLWAAEVERRPYHAFAWSNLGVELQRAGDTTAALEAARHATDLFPTYGESWLNRGRMERAVGDNISGRKSYYRAEELLGDHLDLQMEIARLDAAEGHFDIALARLEAIAPKVTGNEEYEELIRRVRADLSGAKSTGNAPPLSKKT